MHQYQITGFPAEGQAVVRYADSPMQAISYYGDMFTAKNEDGTKRYKTVQLSVGTYKPVNYQDFVALYSA